METSGRCPIFLICITGCFRCCSWTKTRLGRHMHRCGCVVGESLSLAPMLGLRYLTLYRDVQLVIYPPMDSHNLIFFFIFTSFVASWAPSWMISCPTSTQGLSTDFFSFYFSCNSFLSFSIYSQLLLRNMLVSRLCDHLCCFFFFLSFHLT